MIKSLSVLILAVITLVGCDVGTKPKVTIILPYGHVALSTDKTTPKNVEIVIVPSNTKPEGRVTRLKLLLGEDVAGTIDLVEP